MGADPGNQDQHVFIKPEREQNRLDCRAPVSNEVSRLSRSAEPDRQPFAVSRQVNDMLCRLQRNEKVKHRHLLISRDSNFDS
jgi:hypothetical protein